jgi:hypothetical protein
MARETRVTLEAENKFKLAMIGCKNIRKKVWAGEIF